MNNVNILETLAASFLPYTLVTKEEAFTLSKGLLNNELDFKITADKSADSDGVCSAFNLSANEIQLATTDTYTAAAEHIIYLANNVDYSILEAATEEDTVISILGNDDCLTLTMQFTDSGIANGLVIKDTSGDVIASLELINWDTSKKSKLFRDFALAINADQEVIAKIGFTFVSNKADSTPITINIAPDGSFVQLIKDGKELQTLSCFDIETNFIPFLDNINKNI
jgi:hypothetical protein